MQILQLLTFEKQKLNYIFIPILLIRDIKIERNQIRNGTIYRDINCVYIVCVFKQTNGLSKETEILMADCDCAIKLKTI